MKLVSWNVNSVKARLERLLAFLRRTEPDVVCLQELKTPEEKFPREALAAAGYEAAVNGQKTYNGVAILSRRPLEAIELGFGDGVEDEQARFVAASIGGVRVLNGYFPNGQAVGTDKWDYKLDWYGRLLRYLERRCSPDEPLVLCGDLNIAPEDRDTHDPAFWEETVICHPDGRAAMRALLDWGLRDTFRLHHQEGGLYSWWDYRQGAFHKNQGLRLDFILATRPLADRCRETSIDRDERKGPQPSDHAPVMALFDDSVS